jgi:AGZA family xanthine/uracil permease-like MFS transporter
MLDNYFNYKKHKTDFKTEVIAGTTTFLTMAYIMFLNPFILSGEFAGPDKGFFDFGAVYTATILATALACFIMAFYGKTWPIGLAPGMGINAFVAFGVCAGMGYTPQEALGAVLVAGVLFLIISLTPIRAWLINSIPKNKPIPAPIPNFKLLGIELINQALIGVKEIIKNNTPATNTAPKAS